VDKPARNAARSLQPSPGFSCLDRNKKVGLGIQPNGKGSMMGEHGREKKPGKRRRFEMFGETWYGDMARKGVPKCGGGFQIRLLQGTDQPPAHIPVGLERR
jgi:hypothetical protein